MLANVCKKSIGPNRNNFVATKEALGHVSLEIMNDGLKRVVGRCNTTNVPVNRWFAANDDEPMRAMLFAKKHDPKRLKICENDDNSKVEVSDTITVASKRLAPKHEIGTLSRAMR